MNPSLYNLCK